jgi:hypothetical protein
MPKGFNRGVRPEKRVWLQGKAPARPKFLGKLT